MLCEVKSIFSGTQSGLTPEQYERQRREAKRKDDHDRAQAIAEGATLLTHKDRQDYLEGKTPYPTQTIRKEEKFNEFLENIRNRLEADEAINQLPFSVTISINGMYIAEGDEREQFIKWLQDLVLKAQHEHDLERGYSTDIFTFIPYHRAEDGTVQDSMQAFVKIQGPFPGSQLQVDFPPLGGIVYNESRYKDDIKKAVDQLRNSTSEATTSIVLLTIALWSESESPSFSELDFIDSTGAQLNEVSRRYYLVDKWFSKYHDLAAIIRFEKKPRGDFFNTFLDDGVFPVASIITNPDLPDAEEVLKAANIGNCKIITGIASDPLKD